MLLKAERILIVAYGKKLAAARLVTGTSGNLSIFNKAEKLMVISPSGVDYQLMEPEDVVVMNLQQKIVDGKRSMAFFMKIEKISGRLYTRILRSQLQ